MKVLPRSKILVAVIFCLGATTAGAEPHPRARIDANADGVVDFSELQARHPDLTIEEFNKMDSNSDGQLVSEELAAAFTGRMMKRLDADGDGAVSREELEDFGPSRTRPADQVEEFDADGDGKLNQAEFTTMHETMRKQFEAMRGKPGHPGPWRDHSQSVQESPGGA
jgi:Ca2+-binding EF-hand superfamily protein